MPVNTYVRAEVLPLAHIPSSEKSFEYVILQNTVCPLHNAALGPTHRRRILANAMPMCSTLLGPLRLKFASLGNLNNLREAHETLQHAATHLFTVCKEVNKMNSFYQKQYQNVDGRESTLAVVNV